MHKYFASLLCVVLAAPAFAAERRFDFSDMPLDQPPSNCVSIVAGQGKPGGWKVIETDFPLAIQPLTTNAPTTAKKAVVAQLGADFTDEHFPMLLLGDDTYADFTLTTRFQIVSGIIEQMAGLAFRVQDEKNYYVVRASALGNNFRFYKVIKGERGPLFGPEIEITKGEWHELSVECKGNEIRCSLDGKQIIPTLTDNSLAAGRVAYWTKSDSITYFGDTRISYIPREPVVQGLVRETMAQYPHLLGLQISMMVGKPAEPKLVASNNETEIGQPGRKSTADVIKNDTIFTDIDKKTGITSVIMPLRDRNGESLAAVRITMRTFKGQTEENAILRAKAIVDHMQQHVPASNDWNE